MTQPLSPGVYVKEVPSGVRSVSGASTSIPAFIGFTETTPPDTLAKPAPVRSWGEFVQKFHPPVETFVDLTREGLASIKSAYYKVTVDVAFYSAPRTGPFKDLAELDGWVTQALSSKTDTEAAAAAAQAAAKVFEDERNVIGVTETFVYVAKSPLSFTLSTDIKEKATALDTLLKDIKTVRKTWTEANKSKPTDAAAAATLGKLKDLKGKVEAVSTALLAFLKTDDVQAAVAVVKSMADTAAAVAKIVPAQGGGAIAGAPAAKLKELFTDEKLKVVAKAVTEPSTKDFKAIVPKLAHAGTFVARAQAKAQKRSLAEAVYGFFANGGSSCYIVPLTEDEVAKGTIAGDDALGSGLKGLAGVADVSMVVMPDMWSDGRTAEKALPLGQALAEHCATMGNRVAILDAPPAAKPTAADISVFALTGRNQEFAALYYPWVRVPGLDGQPRLVPPSGHIAGVYARTDAERGVFKAPANEALQGVLEVEMPLTDDQQGGLNEKHVNCLRAFPGRGIRVWGARTLAVDSRDFRYINVRRLTCFLADSIKNSTNWAVFEPNNDTLWATLRQTVTTFLTDQWRQGALLGRTPAEAFYVVCDGTNNPPDSIDSGHVICDIGIAPVRPAEFVHFQIKQIAGQSGQGA